MNLRAIAVMTGLTLAAGLNFPTIASSANPMVSTLGRTISTLNQAIAQATPSPGGVMKKPAGNAMKKPAGDAMSHPNTGNSMKKPAGDAMSHPNTGNAMKKPTGDAMKKPAGDAMQKPKQ